MAAHGTYAVVLILQICIVACDMLSCCAATVPPGIPGPSAKLKVTGEWLEAKSKIAGPMARPWTNRVIGVRMRPNKS